MNLSVDENEDEKMMNTSDDDEENEEDRSCCSKYLHYFVPCYCQCCKNDGEEMSIEDAGFLQIFFFTWLYPVIWKGIRKTLTEEDLGKMSKPLRASTAVKRFKYYLNQEKQRVGDNIKRMSYMRAYLNCMKSKFVVIVILGFLASSCEFFSGAIVIRKFLEFLETPDAPRATGFMWALILLATLLVQQSSRHLTIFLATRVGSIGKATVTALIYEKVIRLKSTGNKSVGELVNMCANDATRVFEMSQFMNNLLILPFVIVLNVVYLTIYFGPAALVGLGIVLLYLPIQISFGRIFTRLRGKTVVISDKRVKMISEVLVSIKLIKMYAWERSFAKIIYALRYNERMNLQKMAFVQGFTFSAAYLVLLLAPAATFFTQIYSGQELDVPKAFTLMVMFSTLSFYIVTCPLSLRAISEVLVSFKRIKEFMEMEEHTDISANFSNEDIIAEINGANFAWHKGQVEDEQETSDKNDLDVAFKPDKNEQNTKLITKGSSIRKDIEVPTLFDINFNIKKKQLVGICGSVGSGKSSLIQAFLGQMTLTDGDINVTNSIAYVSQQAWIMNATVRDNILFGKEYEESFYKDVCTACALDDDFKLMTSGDLTEIGERGVNLSGGQKQRISLARAVYAEKELYLLDDPLSAVDSHVGKHIFEKCIKVALQRHAVIFVTHQLQFLKDCDYIYYMHDGRFAEHGTYDQLINNNQEFAHDIRKFQEEDDKGKEKKHAQEYAEDFDSKHRLLVEAVSKASMHRSHHTLTVASSSMCGLELEMDEEINQDIEDRDEEKKILEEKGKLIEKEEKAKGSVSLKTYTSFCQFAGGYFVSFLVLLSIVTSVATLILSEYWISNWLHLKGSPVMINKTLSNNKTILVMETVDTDRHMTLYAVIIASVVLATVISTLSTVYVLLRGVSALHNEVFKRILESPMEFFDTTPIGRIMNRLAKDVDDIDNYLPWMFETAVRNLTRVVGSIIVTGMILPYILVAVIPLVIMFLVINHFFRKLIRSIKRIDNVSRSPIFSHLTSTVQGLLTIRAFGNEKQATNIFHRLVNKNMFAFYMFNACSRGYGILVDTICISMAICVVFAAVFLKEEISPSLIGLCLVYMLRIIGLFQFAFRILAEVEAKFTSVERLDHYVQTLKSEELPEASNQEISDSWPENGSIQFENVGFRYRDGLPLVMTDFTLNVEDKEKVGIVGRTGAGKSSIAVVLYRIVNSEIGTIKIAGKDIKKISLFDLRSKLSIIPQDPILFIGTIRYNLDPFNSHNDEELWNVLEKAHIKDMISELPEKLQSMVLENGSNFSVGERQLICMARALLRKSKVLILDEATAAIDSKTDSKIQETIKESFRDCTVLTVAHRLNTIMHCDKILVMEQGHVAEYDSPSALLGKDSQFKKMVEAANTRTSDQKSNNTLQVP